MQSIRPHTHTHTQSSRTHSINLFFVYVFVFVFIYIYMNNDSTLHTYRIYFWTKAEGNSIKINCSLLNVFTFYLVSWNGFTPPSLFLPSDLFRITLCIRCSCSCWFRLHRLLNSIWCVWMRVSVRGLRKEWEKCAHGQAGVPMREVNRRWRIKKNECRKLCWMEHFCVSALIDRGTLFKFDGRKVLRNEKCLSHKARTLQGQWWQLNADYTPNACRTHVYILIHAQWWPEPYKQAQKNSFRFFSVWAWLWPLMPNSTSKSKCGQFSHCTMGYHKSSTSFGSGISSYQSTWAFPCTVRIHIHIAVFTDDRSIRYVVLH